MKAYLMTTGLLFALLAVSHAYFSISVIGSARASSHMAHFDAIVAIIGAALAIWAWRLLRKAPAAR